MLTRRNLLAAAPLTVLGVALTTTPALAATFTDLPSDSPFYTEMNWAVTKGLLTTYPDGSIRPNDPVDRQTFARMIYTYRGKPSYTPPTKTPFSDVPTTHPYYKDICWLASQGITAGYWDKTFRPANLVERNTFAIFLYRMAGEPAYFAPVVSPFIDTPPSTEFYKQICWLKDMKISNGWSDGTFKPLEVTGRYAASAFLYRYNQVVGY